MNWQKLLRTSYLVGLHLVLIALVVKTATFQNFMKDGAASNPHGQIMIGYHKAMDGSVPAGAAIFLGDSITQGLATAAVAPDSVNFGIGAATTSELLRNLPSYKSLERASSIFLLIGTNDIGEGLTRGLDERLRAISLAIPLDKPLIWSGIMPAYSDRHRPEMIAAANKTIHDLCSRRTECFYIDTQAIFSADRSLLSDGVHPNDAGYSRWIDALRAAHAQASTQKANPSRRLR
jgi:lysophospholipase L1-like esterase